MVKRKTRTDGRYESTTRVNGKKKHFYGSTQHEAKQKRDEYVELMRRCPLADRKVTLGEWAEAWLQSIKSDVAPTTLESYTGLLTNHIIKAQIGSILLENLTPALFRLYWQQLLDSGLSPRTVTYLHTVTSEVLKQATMDGALAYNPLVNVRRPHRVKKEIKALTKDQIKLLLDHIKNEKLNRIVRFALATGMRREEILGLRWYDVNFTKSMASVVQTVVRCGSETVISPTTKTKSSQRTISIDKHTMNLLHIQNAYDMRLKVQNPNYQDNDLVFCAGQVQICV